MQELFKKFIKDECSKEEIEQIVSYFKNSKDLDDFPTVESIEKLVEDYPSMEASSANRIYDNIIKISKTDTKSKQRQIQFWPYVAAAVFIGILTTVFTWETDLFITPDQEIPKVADSKTIVPGTDKATLTLEDGTTMQLEEGVSFQTPNAKSTGDKLIYKPSKNKGKAIAYNYLTIPRGGQFFLTLSDGTQVWLNSESQIKYPVAFTEGETRKVELVYGEVYFDVSPSTDHKGAKFKVENNAQEVQVLGTEFNIKAYKNEPNIFTTLVEGKVLVTTENNKKNLNPNEQSSLNLSSGDIETYPVDVYREISWKQGVFSFKDKSLEDIMKVLSRWYDVNVIFEDEKVGGITFNGSLEKKLSIKEILDIIIGSTNDINYEIMDKTIFIN